MSNGKSLTYSDSTLQDASNSNGKWTLLPHQTLDSLPTPNVLLLKSGETLKVVEVSIVPDPWRAFIKGAGKRTKMKALASRGTVLEQPRFSPGPAYAPPSTARTHPGAPQV